MIDVSMLPDFIIEATEHLEDLESSLLHLEEQGDEREVLDDIFRAMHTIKGAAQFVGIERIAELSHKLENLFDLIRKGERQLDENLVDLLIESKDRITQLVGELERTQEEETDILDLSEQITAIVEGTPVPGSDSEGIQPGVSDDATGQQTEADNGSVEANRQLDTPDIIEECLELNESFLSNLKEYIPFVQKLTYQYATSSDKMTPLVRSVEAIRSLKSSAEHERLAQQFSSWLTAMDEAIQDLNADLEPSLNMQSFIDEILRICPQFEAQGGITKSDGDLDPSSEMGTVPTDTEDDHDLEAVLDSFFAEDDNPLGAINLHDNEQVAEPVHQVVQPGPLENEAFGENHDEELLDIFMQQLRENISFLRGQSDKLAVSSDRNSILKECVQAITTLKSSANYMGYEQLVRHYSAWQEAVDSTVAQLATGGVPDCSFMQSFADAVAKAYPQVLEDVEIERLAVDDELDSALDDVFSESSEPGETEQHDLEAALDSFFAEDGNPPGAINLLNEKQTAEPVHLAVPPGPLENESEGEEYDEELLSIFMQQLQEKIPFLRAQGGKLAGLSDRKSVLKDCVTAINALKASANYMGYEQLVRHYNAWQEAIDSTVFRLASGAVPDCSFMQSFADTVSEAYPQAQEIMADDDNPQEKPAAALVDTLDETESTLSAVLETPSLQSEISGDEYDKELLSIFFRQLGEQVPELQTLTDVFPGSVDQEDIVARCVKSVMLLASSANYMGYEQLTRFYTSWLAAVDEADKQLAAGDTTDFSFMQAYIDRLVEAYPQIKENERATEAEDHDKLEFEDITENIDFPLISKTEAYDATVAAVSVSDEPEKHTQTESAPEITSEDLTATKQDSEQELFDRLSTAFDASLEQTDNVLLNPMHGVIKEMITSSADENIQSDFKPKITAQSSPVKTGAKAKTESGETDQKETVVKQKDDKNPPPTVAVESMVHKTVQQDQLSKKNVESKIKRVSVKKVKQSMRVDAEKIDFLMNQVGELVVSRAYFAQLFSEMKELQQNLLENSGLTKNELKPFNEFAFRLSQAGVGLGRVSNELQEGVMRVRMLPIEQLFKRFPRLVRDLVHKTDKKVTLTTRGEKTELDKMVIEEISDPLIHIIRNAVDHGIESSEERKRLGKPENARIILEAYHESDHIVIEVTDDGRGIDEKRVKEKAFAMGLYTQEELNRMSSLEVKHLIMQPGFSTTEKATKTSGRGVGMDVVKKNIEKLNGSVEIETKFGVGTRIRTKIPLTMAIIQALMVRVGTEKYTIPLTSVEETLRVFQHEISEIEGVDVIHIRDSTMPIFKLSKIFGIDSASHGSDKLFVVVVSTGLQELGLVVDELLGQEEVVIKPIADYLQTGSGFSGATILGNGGISLILDIPELVKMTTDKQVSKQKKMSFKRRMSGNDEPEQQVSMIQ